MAVLQHCRQIVTSTFCERARRCFQNAYFHKTITFEKYFKKQLGKKKKIVSRRSGRSVLQNSPTDQKA